MKENISAANKQCWECGKRFRKTHEKESVFGPMEYWQCDVCNVGACYFVDSGESVLSVAGTWIMTEGDDNDSR